MIEFINLSQKKPFQIFKKKYKEAIIAGQKNIDAIAISSFNKDSDEVDSRFVNLKFINNEQFIFFSNYDSPKSVSFKSHDQISALFFWSSTNTQIRIKAKIFKTSSEFNQEYFKKRSIDKNALSICSRQSKPIPSFNEVIDKYNKVKEVGDLRCCPDYWGGFAFVPYQIEFWVGNKNRLNKRDLFKNNKSAWDHTILEP